MSSYIAGITIFLLVLSPLFIPTVVSAIHAIGKSRSDLTLTDRANGQRRLRPAV
jgi:hypothetical protein